MAAHGGLQHGAWSQPNPILPRGLEAYPAGAGDARLTAVALSGR